MVCHPNLLVRLCPGLGKKTVTGQVMYPGSCYWQVRMAGAPSDERQVLEILANIQSYGIKETSAEQINAILRELKL